jgi:hypothetical protein
VLKILGRGFDSRRLHQLTARNHSKQTLKEPDADRMQSGFLRFQLNELHLSFSTAWGDPRIFRAFRSCAACIFSSAVEPDRKSEHCLLRITIRGKAVTNERSLLAEVDHPPSGKRPFLPNPSQSLILSGVSLLRVKCRDCHSVASLCGKSRFEEIWCKDALVVVMCRSASWRDLPDDSYYYMYKNLKERRILYS